MLQQLSRCNSSPPEKRWLCTFALGSKDAPQGDLAAEFSQHVVARGVRDPAQGRRPTPMLPPTAVVAAQLDALQINDWPEPDAGVRTAYVFSKPHACEEMTAGQVLPRRAHGWEAGAGEWVTLEDFARVAHSDPYRALLGCESWQVVSEMKFPRTRSGEHAVQAVSVMARRDTGDSPLEGAEGSRNPREGFEVAERGWRRGGFLAPERSGLRSYTFTFCLERITSGPYKDCWMTVGLRCGDYANV
ncbi:hypothetical protein WJX81_000058 [Elliptochloris bilobata]|uniref:Uncharacterized protein n=1 Tax=Elliptochloris bilobata TaxID=381761 RepID=A0AAW1R465_9CHLO